MDMKVGFFCGKVFILVAVCLLQCNHVAVSASDSKLQTGISQAPSFPLATRMLGETTVVADFDGDNKEDVASACLIGSQYRIVIQLSSRSEATTLSLPVRFEGFTLLAYDINEDSFQDLVLTTSAAQRPLMVWLGDGRGGFRVADQEPFGNEFGFTASPRYDSCRFPLQQDLLTEPWRSVCEKPLPAFADLCLEREGFIRCNTNIHPIRNLHFSLTLRSPPADLVL
jgi:hypothetical protein